MEVMLQYTYITLLILQTCYLRISFSEHIFYFFLPKSSKILLHKIRSIFPSLFLQNVRSIFQNYFFFNFLSSYFETLYLHNFLLPRIPKI